MANEVAILETAEGLILPWRGSIPRTHLLSSSKPDDRLGLVNATAAKLEEQGRPNDRCDFFHVFTSHGE